MIPIAAVREAMAALQERHGHLQVATACIRTLAGYATEGARVAAVRANELVLEELRVEASVRVGTELRGELRELLRRGGHQALAIVVAELAEQYAWRGARARAAEEEGGDERCPGCRERDASLVSLRRLRERTTTGRPLGGSTPTKEQGDAQATT